MVYSNQTGQSDLTAAVGGGFLLKCGRFWRLSYSERVDSKLITPTGLAIPQIDP